MKCILPLTKIVIFMLTVSMLAACASKSSKQSANSQQFAANVPAKFVNSKAAAGVAEQDKNQYKKALDFLQSGELQRAEKILKEISAKYPHMVGPFVNLGIIAMKEGRWIEAESLFSSAQIYSRNPSEVFNYLGVVYRQQGKFSEAKKAYLLAIAEDEKFSSAYLNLGILFDLYLSDYVMAKKYYLEYQALAPDDQKVKSWLVDIDQRMQAHNR